MEWNCGNDIAEIGGEKKLFQLVCGNGIDEIEVKKSVTIDLWQWNCRRSKRKKNGLWQWHCRNRGERYKKKNLKSTHILILSVFF